MHMLMHAYDLGENIERAFDVLLLGTIGKPRRALTQRSIQRIAFDLFASTPECRHSCQVTWYSQRP